MVNSKIVEAAKKNNRRIQFERMFRSIFDFPSWQNAGLAVLSAVLLILAFPDFELWFLAWFALVPLFVAVERCKNSLPQSFWLGVLNGFIFFTGTCWWLTHAPINYGGIPAPIAYFLLFPATLGAGFFVGIFAAILSRLLSKFGHFAIFFAPVLWVACEFLRLQITGNAWNAFGYSQAFSIIEIQAARFGGVFLISAFLVFKSTVFVFCLFYLKTLSIRLTGKLGIAILLFCIALSIRLFSAVSINSQFASNEFAVVVALQPNVPMSGLTLKKYDELRERHVEMAETVLREVASKPELATLPKIVVFPESPMNYQYAHDSEFREFLADFTARNKVSLVFNAGEPNSLGDGYHNSAVMVNERGERIAQYDKIRLVPFGEFVPEWLPGNELLPTVVGRTKPGKDFRLMPFGDVRVGTLICYESAFGDLSAGFVRNGADVLIELTNDGYGGNTPILRQHLANAVFRAVETNRPVLRVTNIGITTFINERGEMTEAPAVYEAATRVWTIAKSDGAETFYVRYGDLFAWICTVLTGVLLALTFWRKR